LDSKHGIKPTSSLASHLRCSDRRGPGRQHGATLIEFAVTLGLFFLLILAIFEFVIMVLVISRANEATRDMARLAIVSDPVCNIWGTSCPGGVPLSCPAGTPITATLAGASNCTANSTDTACRMLNRAQLHLPNINGSQIEVRYGCSGTSRPNRPEPVPLVTVALRNATHPLAVPTLLGLSPQIGIPAFETTRVAEDINTSQKRY
jgi:hypothetical protein